MVVPRTLDTQGVEIPKGVSALAINALSRVSTREKSIRRITFNRNLSTFQQDNIEGTVRSLVEHVRDLQRALDDLYSRSLAVPTEDVDGNGFPSHGSTCTALDGQYIHIFRPNTALTNLVAVAHGLGRVPQGALIVYDEGDNSPTPCIFGAWDRIAATEDIPPATSSVIYFRYGPNTFEGDRTIFVIF